MTYRRVHLHLCPHGAPTSLATVEYACAVSKAFAASLRVTSPHWDVKAPSHGPAARRLAGIAQSLEDAAAATSAELESHVRRTAASLGLSAEIIAVPVAWPGRADDLAPLGRLSDLCILGLPRHGVEQGLEVEAWLFGSGRPCLLHPNDRDGRFSLDQIAVAWDMSRSAARAIGDALPLLERAKEVRILIGRGEKGIVSTAAGAQLIEYLAAHEVRSVADEFDVEGRGIGHALLERAEAHRADLLVMGAYGHSRLKEFILGGATHQALGASRLPLLMAH